MVTLSWRRSNDRQRYPTHTHKGQEGSDGRKHNSSIDDHMVKLTE